MDILRLPARTESLEAFRTFILKRVEPLDIPVAILFKIELVLEELLTNVIHYAYPDGSSGDVEVTCALGDDRRLRLMIRDWGIPFDPRKHKCRSLEGDLAHREIGGLGIHLVRELACELDYAREEGSNCLNFYLQL